MMAKFTMWEILRLGFVSHESKCSPEHFWLKKTLLVKN